MKIAVSKLPTREFSGDWHDAPLKWQVAGPDTELQKFSTKREAQHYASIRRKSASFNEACATFGRTNG